MSKEELFSKENQDNSPTEPSVEDKDYLVELVGEGKKFGTVNDLAKGKAQSDAFIEQLKREQQELREALAQSKSVEEHLNDLRSAVMTHNKKEGNPSEMTPDQNEAGAKPVETSAQKTPSPDDIRSIVEQEVNRRVSIQKQEQNIDSVINAAKQVYGENYKQELSNKAAELGSSPDELFSIAEKNPNLFKSIMGLNAQASEAPAQKSANRIFESVNTDALRSQNRSTGRKSYSDFEALRKENPVKYFSPEVQNEMFKLAQEIGPEFLNS